MRLLWVFLVATWGGCVFAVRAVAALMLGRRQSVPAIAGEVIAGICDRIGGAYLKAGQILSTRVDLFPLDALVALDRLRDRVRPLTFNSLRSVLEPLQGLRGDDGKLEIEPIPLASATIAQVHVGTILHSKERVAIKIRRPGVDRVLKADVCHIRFFTTVVARLPWFRRFPISEATNEVCSALLHQIDFATEARMLERFRVLFAENPRIKIPEVDLARCNGDFIVMECLEGYRPFQCFRDQPELARSAVQTGLRALYRMIFNAGLIHCDLHPSNILCNDEGQVALLDFGFVSEMTPKAKQDFAEFFLCIAFRDGKTAARIVRETALRVAGNLDPVAFERDMQALVEKTAGRKAADFQVAGFVFELFQVQRRHGIYGSPSFTLPILSLLTYEGLIKDLHPEIDFQQESVPFVISAVAGSL